MPSNSSYINYGHNHHVAVLKNRIRGKTCAYCGSRIRQSDDPYIAPNLNGMGPNTRAHLKCAIKAGVTH